MINQAGLDLIKRWEGCKLKAYKDVAGVWTVGYGLTTGAGFIEVGPDTELTQEEADWYLERAVNKFADEIRGSITAPINDNQFAAFVSLAYNIGSGGFKRSSALKHFNAGRSDLVPNAMRMWKKAGGKVVQGLVNRREAEIQLFLTPVVEVAHPKPTGRTSPSQSKTVQASAVQIASGVGAGVSAFAALDGAAQLVAIGFAGLVTLMAVWIMRERLKKWANGVR